MINLLTAPPGVGKTLFAVMQLKKVYDQNNKNIPVSKANYAFNIQHLLENADKKITVDLVEFKGNQNLFEKIRTSLKEHEGKEISLLEYFECFNDYDFGEFNSEKVTPQHYFLSTSYNLIANFANKQLDTKFKPIPPVRQIYSDINGLRIDDVLESPDDWRTCPDGSVIFYDEVQNRKIYKNTKEKNDIIGDLTVHRHRGFDIWFITQFPVLIHTEVRAVVGNHYHLSRPWGLPQAYVHVWSYAVVDPNSFSKKRAAERTFRFSYSKDIYKLYTSSTMHTHKINLPKKLIFLGIVMCGGLYMAYNGFSKGTIFNKGSDVTEKVNAAQQANPFQKGVVIPEQYKEQVKLCVEQFKWTEQQCLEAYDSKAVQARNESLKTSTGNSMEQVVVNYNPNKPFETSYNPNVQAVDFPKFSGCMKKGNRYVAYTQQGTILHEVSDADCRRVIEDGDRPFDYFRQPQQVKNNAGIRTETTYSEPNKLDVLQAANLEEKKKTNLEPNREQGVI